MNIAIIGGGAAGMICAYLLDKAGHRVSVFEKQAILGGNIRTTNQNLQVPGLSKHLHLEGGVVEFSAAFHRFRALMTELEVDLEPVSIGTALFLQNGRTYLSSSMIPNNASGFRKIGAYFRLLSLYANGFDIWLRSRKLKASELREQSMDAFLGKSSLAVDWLKNFSMYSYSLPFAHIAQFPAELGIPSIKDYILADWFRIRGGVYSYIEKILARFSGTVHLGAEVQAIHRNQEGVQMQWNDQSQGFDKVVFACPPDQVLGLLSDPTKDEQHRFGAWKANHARTVIHADDRFYQRYQIDHPSPFDFFQTPDGWAYNAYLNQLCGVAGDTPYFLSFNMESLIDPQKIIHIQEHHTPFYTVDAFRFRQEIIDTNGENHTFHAGAYLGDGLHEGAVVSAERVWELIGNA